MPLHTALGRSSKTMARAIEGVILGVTLSPPAAKDASLLSHGSAAMGEEEGPGAERLIRTWRMSRPGRLIGKKGN